jgi:hypothetical protein
VPVLVVPGDARSLDIIGNAIRKNIEALDDEQRDAFYALHNMHDGKQDIVLDIVHTNALPLGAGAAQGGVFLQAARFNHACNSNAQNSWNPETEHMTIQVNRDVKSGEEICLSCLDGLEKYASQQRLLKARFGFSCTCMICSLPETQRDQSDTRLEEIARLDSIVGDGMSIVTTPLVCLHHLRTMIVCKEKECIADARVARAYYDALQISIAHGDQARAKAFSERAYRERVFLEGDDSPEARRFKRLIERPSIRRLYGTTIKWKQGPDKILQGSSAKSFET